MVNAIFIEDLAVIEDRFGIETLFNETRPSSMKNEN